jgi:biotin synthase
VRQETSAKTDPSFKTNMLSKGEILYGLTEEPAGELYARARAVCEANYGPAVFFRGLVEFSNHCGRDCLYCGIRKSNAKSRRYRMTPEEIAETVKAGFEGGLRTFVLQCGEDPDYTTDRLRGVSERIRRITGDEAAITLGAGIRSRRDYALLKGSGIDRYLLRFETADPSLHERLRNGIPLKRRIRALADLKELGYEVGSGFMVGLPGETGETRAANILLSQDLDLDMAGVGPFIPHPQTPLGESRQESIELALRSTALVRLALPRANIPATTASGSIDPLGREKMLEAGANVLMPNITPPRYKKDYLLYPGKICVDEDGLQCLSCLGLRLSGIGKTVSLARGDAMPRRCAQCP